MKGLEARRIRNSLSTCELIRETVRQIPRGRVATYGQIASEAGFPGQARMVGYALHTLPIGSAVPWHRVINAQGRISFPKGTDAYRKQRHLLKSESVGFSRDVVDLDRFGWLTE
jgi:methylated-DNA-protein-cysteine methyltransferase-like protein